MPNQRRPWQVLPTKQIQTLMDHPERQWLRHEIPSWVTMDDTHPTFFITICCKNRNENQLAYDSIWKELLESIQNREERGIWKCPLFLVMPDHLHAFLSFRGSTRMKQAIADWKRWTARQHGIEWQQGFFDHRIRNRDGWFDQRNYILQKTVTAGLVKKPEDWSYVYDQTLDR